MIIDRTSFTGPASSTMAIWTAKKPSRPNAATGHGRRWRRACIRRQLRREVRTKIVAVNAFKLLHKMGIKAGPSFVPHTKFPLWRPATWKNRKIVPGIAFVGLGDVARCESAKAVHPFDFVRSTR